MTLPTFTPLIAPSPGTRHKPEVKLREAPFGDGYAQAAPDGLNHIRRVVTLTWAALPKEVAEQLDAFFVERGGYKAFLYQPEGFAAPVGWTCREWSSSSTTPWTYSATLRQDFSGTG